MPNKEASQSTQQQQPKRVDYKQTSNNSMIAYLESKIAIDPNNCVRVFPTSYITIDRSKLIA